VIRPRRLAAVLSLAALLASSSTPGAVNAQTAPELDWALPAGRYFTQAGAGAGGYSIADDDGLPFWKTFQQLGGVPALGYPASRRFTLGGFTYQATQAALLQWRPDQSAVVLGNTFELLQDAGKDAWLKEQKGIPAPVTNDGSSSYDDAVRIRLGWLSEPSIRERYLQNPNPAGRGSWGERDSIQLYGLPMSRPERAGPFIAQRFQRIAFQLWVEQVPGLPAPGSVTAVFGGDLLKEARLIDGMAATPHTAAAVVSRPVAVGLSAAPTAAPLLPTATVRPAATATPRAAATATARPVATPRPGGSVQVLDGTLSEFSIFLPQITARLGTVRFVMNNVGTLRHNLRVVGNGLDVKTADLRGGQTGQVEVTFVDPGPYLVYCDLADHEDLGMTLTLNVQP
jgi:plastocyanin